MEISQEELDDGIIKINLSGRMDINGVAEIEEDFAIMCAYPRTSIIVDMSDVPYMSSIGIRALLINGKALKSRSGKYVLMSPQKVVKNVLEVSGISRIIDMCDDEVSALAKVKN